MSLCVGRCVSVCEGTVFPPSKLVNQLKRPCHSLIKCYLPLCERIAYLKLREPQKSVSLY